MCVFMLTVIVLKTGCNVCVHADSDCTDDWLQCVCIHADNDCTEDWLQSVDAYENARHLCEQYYEVAPECEFHVRSRECFVHHHFQCCLHPAINTST